ncbi:MAG: helix-turn-helix domain-containing protein [Rhodobacteraceae bacterium]|nr:helix-turn-helix domain-containing protein [Paracoccaceae bacterium]
MPVITLPVPLIVSLIALYLLVRAVLGGARWPAFWGLLGMTALQGALISLVHHYGVSGLRFVLPVTAAAIPALAWLAFRTSLIRPLDLPRDAIHAATPAFAAFCALAAPQTLDAVVVAVFAGYGAAILMALHRDAGALPLARLEAGGLPVRVWRALAVALIVSAASDVGIALVVMSGRADLTGAIISTFSSAALLAIAVLGLWGDGLGQDEGPAPETPAGAAQDTADDRALVARLDALLEGERLYLDADLTLARLARRLRVPAKQLSAAVNRATGENISRYVNGFRIRHACGLLAQRMPVTEAIYASGFNTKSNFNREFRRVTGHSPSDWQADQSLARST